MKPLLPPLAAFAVVLLVAGLSACGAEPEVVRKLPAPGERVTITETLISSVKPASAVIVSRDIAEARARVGGTLTEMRVREGDTVRQGQELGIVADSWISLQTAAYDAQVASAQAEAARAGADLTRVQALFDKGIYSEARLEQSLAAARAANAQVRAARALRSASAETGIQGRILAPTSGRVLTADVPAGSVVTAGQPVAILTAGPLVLRLELPEAEGRTLRVGQSVGVSSDDLPGIGTGVIAQVYPATRAGRTTADITVASLDSDRVGQRVTVEVPLGQRRALVIPDRAVARRYGLDFVRTIDRDGRVSEAPIERGVALGGDRHEVLSGLAAGDVVLVPDISS